MTRTQDRQECLAAIQDAIAAGASKAAACMEAGICAKTMGRWLGNADDKRPTALRQTHANALTDEEKACMVATANSPEFASASPAQIVAAQADQGVYIASEASYYRVLKEADQLAHRGKARKASARKPPTTLVAANTGEVWVWDVTWLASVICGAYFRLYTIMDLYSRKIISWEVFVDENAENSEDVLRRAALAENIAAGKTPFLHGDNGAPLKNAHIHAKMLAMGVKPSNSRPRVSNDNAHAEALFRTVKYHPSLPEKPFRSLEDARAWVATFVQWYNHEHRHSALNMVTPDQKHRGLDTELLAKRHALLEEARAKNPRRWIKGKIRNCSPTILTTLNPVNDRKIERELKKAA